MSHGTRMKWNATETYLLLSIVEDREILQLLENKKLSRKEIFTIIQDDFKAKGYDEKDAIHIETKWKNMKKLYVKCRKVNDQAREDISKCEYYDELHHLLATRIHDMSTNSPISSPSSSSNILTSAISHAKIIPKSTPTVIATPTKPPNRIFAPPKVEPVQQPKFITIRRPPGMETQPAREMIQLKRKYYDEKIAMKKNYYFKRDNYQQEKIKALKRQAAALELLAQSKYTQILDEGQPDHAESIYTEELLIEDE